LSFSTLDTSEIIPGL